MKYCELCGNPFPDDKQECPYCKHSHPQEKTHKKVRREIIRTINLEEGMPTVEEAMIRLERNLNFAKHEGVPLIRIIHGYGSSGVGGDIRVACHHYLQRALYQRKIKAFFPGESLSVTTPEGQNLLQRYPSLKKDKGNCGITLVELSF